MTVDKLEVFKGGVYCGLIIREDKSYSFIYDSKYIKDNKSKPVHPAMPLYEKPYKSKEFFPVFENLSSEGDLRIVQAKRAKIDVTDTMSLLGYYGDVTMSDLTFKVKK